LQALSKSASRVSRYPKYRRPPRPSAMNDRRLEHEGMKAIRATSVPTRTACAGIARVARVAFAYSTVEPNIVYDRSVRPAGSSRTVSASLTSAARRNTVRSIAQCSSGSAYAVISSRCVRSRAASRSDRSCGSRGYVERPET
jgi:hypothetical protein